MQFCPKKIKVTEAILKTKKKILQELHTKKETGDCLMETRKETDPLGEKAIPKNAYYGIQTLRATENFPVSGIKAPAVFIKAYVLVKKAAALANTQVGWLDPKMGKAIVQACDEILAGKFLNQFVVDVYQAGAGTSFNMNVNEVIANRTLEILGKAKGDYKTVSPNDHVNMAQSTNDTFPTALHIAILMALQPLLKELEQPSRRLRRTKQKTRQHTEIGSHSPPRRGASNHRTGIRSLRIRTQKRTRPVKRSAKAPLRNCARRHRNGHGREHTPPIQANRNRGTAQNDGVPVEASQKRLRGAPELQRRAGGLERA